MANTALNRTVVAILTNKSGGALDYGDVVVLDNTNADGFTTTTSAALATRGIGVIIEQNGIANDASGMVAVGGWVPQVNLDGAATVGQFINTDTVAGQATPHDAPQVAGDFGVVLAASATPPAILFGSPNQPGGGGGGTPGGSTTEVQYNNAGSFGGITGATSDGTALTLVAPVLGTPASGTLTNCDGLPLSGLATPPPGTELSYVQFTSAVTPTATTEATADTVVSSASVAYDGSTVVIVEFFSPNARTANAAAAHTMSFWLYEDSASIGLLGFISNGSGGAQGFNEPVALQCRLTPSSASHVYSVRCSVNSGTGLVNGGAGGGGTAMPGFIRITRV